MLFAFGYAARTECTVTESAASPLVLLHLVNHALLFPNLNFFYLRPWAGGIVMSVCTYTLENDRYSKTDRL